MMITQKTSLADLTVGEFIKFLNGKKAVKIDQPKRSVYGINGLAKLLQCSRPTAQRIKNSGEIPYSQVGRKLVFDADAVLKSIQKLKAMNSNKKHSLLKSLREIGTKNKNYKTQMRQIIKAFAEKPKTMLEVSIETGIMRASICRRVAELKKQNRIQVYKLGICPITKHPRVQFLTMNPELIVKPLTLFDNGK